MMVFAADDRRYAVAEQHMSLLSHEKLVFAHTIEEQMGNVGTYPVHIQEMLLSKHLSFGARFSLTLFILQNGLPPQLYAEWLIGRGMLRDEAARNHVASIIKDHQDGKLEETAKTAYKMHATAPNGDALPLADRVQTVLTPNFARMWQTSYFWGAAIATLQNKNITATTVSAEWKKQAAATKIARVLQDEHRRPTPIFQP